MRFTLVITLPIVLFAAWLEIFVGPKVSDGPTVLELSQADQTTCDELAGYYEQVASGVSLAKVQRIESTLNAENTYPVKAAYEAYENAEEIHETSRTGEADEALERARLAYVQACIL